jgi:hypothetical protein
MGDAAMNATSMIDEEISSRRSFGSEQQAASSSVAPAPRFGVDANAQSEFVGPFACPTDDTPQAGGAQ